MGALREFWVCSGLLWAMLLDLDRRFRLSYLQLGDIWVIALQRVISSSEILKCTSESPAVWGKFLNPSEPQFLIWGTTVQWTLWILVRIKCHMYLQSSAQLQARYMLATIILIIIADILVEYFDLKTTIPYKSWEEHKGIFKMSYSMGLCVLCKFSRNTSNISQTIKQVNLNNCNF